ncbi:Hsp20/alpha crystallin family protein [Camelliibacillus cellulosilyticus]|uniref:Hsp20/alpha crystallin family protein n=1 Tax=Camelliibacillus cellulosilyticus TaxID=2174486 RepID=A0ABV9GNV3_9BACL
MAEEDKNKPSQPGNGMIPFGGDFLRRIDDFFFANEPNNNILNTIDAFFQNHPFAAAFPVDLYETADEWVVRANLPGVEKENIHIETLGDRLRIAVMNDERVEENNEVNNYYHHERRMQRMERVIQLPYTAHRQRTKASYRNGILEVRGPKYPKTKNTLEIE